MCAPTLAPSPFIPANPSVRSHRLRYEAGAGKRHAWKLPSRRQSVDHSSLCAYRCKLKRGDCLGPGEAESQRGETRGAFRRRGPGVGRSRAITIDDYDSSPEERFVTLGLDALARVLVVVYAWSAEISG